MEPKTKKQSTTETVAFIEKNFPPGTELRHIGTGSRYIIGTKHGIANFWMMSIAESKKGLMPAATIKDRFQKSAA